MRRRLLMALFLLPGMGRCGDLPSNIHPELAVIEGPQALSPFAAALNALAAGTRDRVSVCHFGDSHLQEGEVDQVLRDALQARYGNAGRGYVFPYEAMNTGTPADVGSVTDADWRLRRMMGDSSGGPVGPGGLAAISSQPNFVLGVDVHGGSSQASAFDRVKVFYVPGPDKPELWVATRPQPAHYSAELRNQTWRELTIKSGDTLSGIAQREGCTVADLKRWNGATVKLRAGGTVRLWKPVPADAPRMQGFTVWGVLSGQDPLGPEGVTVDLGSPSDDVFLLGAQTQGASQHAELQGLVLDKRGTRGILWHSLAANGAQAKHYAAQPELPEQGRSLAPDLIIVSLGTNETQTANYRIQDVLAQQLRFWRVLRQAAPQASLLICSPPDAGYKHHGSNDRLDAYVAAIKAQALNEGAAFLDLRAAQGGAGSYQRWRAVGLAGKDGVHYKSAGYRLLGEWTLNALLSVPGVEGGHAR